MDVNIIKQGIPADKKTTSKISEKTKKLHDELVTILKKHGSLEFISQLQTIWFYSDFKRYYTILQTFDESAIIKYFLGLFLKYHNLDAKDVSCNLPRDTMDKLCDYYASICETKLQPDGINPSNLELTDFLSNMGKAIGESKSLLHDSYKDEHTVVMFQSVSDYFKSKYGFTTNEAISFMSELTNYMENMIEKRLAFGSINFKNSYDDFKANRDMGTPLDFSSADFDRQFETSLHSVFNLLGVEKVFAINVEWFSNYYSLDRVAFKNFLDAQSCKIGQQYDDFEYYYSKNILDYKSFIKFDEQNYYFIMPDITMSNPDLILEHFLVDEKQNNTAIWKKYESSKSKYLEELTFEYISRVFPEKQLYRNLFYTVGQTRHEVDLLVLYDNKILVVDSKSNLAYNAKIRDRNYRNGSERIEDTKNLKTPAQRVKRYIQLSDVATFENESGDVILSLDNKNKKYDIMFTNVVLSLDDLPDTPIYDITLRINDQQWVVHLHDLNMVTAFITSPLYFLHYIHQHLFGNNKVMRKPFDEIYFLAIYLKTGNFYDHESDFRLLSREYSLEFDIKGKFESFLDDKENFTAPSIPLNPISDLIENLEKYKQPGFSDIIFLLLDLQIDDKKFIADTIKDYLQEIRTLGQPNECYVCSIPLNLGFSYFIADTTTNLYRLAKRRTIMHKYENKLSRWAMICRNVNDKKNAATGFFYIDDPWKFDPELESRAKSTDSNFFDDF
ncbi:MAG: hypothetical protein OXC46_05050 [Thaumarchaeota archaeon]|nr:hypothetical protein [Nitrososphaerota archaeon]